MAKKFLLLVLFSDLELLPVKSIHEQERGLKSSKSTLG